MYIFRIQLDEAAHLEDSCFCIVYLLVFHHGTMASNETWLVFWNPWESTEQNGAFNF